MRKRLDIRHFQFQHELLPLLERDVDERLSPALQRVVRTLECVEIERFVADTRGQPGRPQRDRAALARAFVAKAVLGLSQTRDLIERLSVDKTLRRLCGFDLRDRRGLNESLFSRAFAQFAQRGLPARVHEALIQRALGDALVCHLSRDSTAIAVRESAASKAAAIPATPRKRGRPKKGEVRPPAPLKRLERQSQGISLAAMLADLPCACDIGQCARLAGRLAAGVDERQARDFVV